MNAGISFGKELYEKKNKNNHYFACHLVFIFHIFIRDYLLIVSCNCLWKIIKKDFIDSLNRLFLNMMAGMRIIKYIG